MLLPNPKKTNYHSPIYLPSFKSFKSGLQQISFFTDGIRNKKGAIFEQISSIQNVKMPLPTPLKKKRKFC